MQNFSPFLFPHRQFLSHERILVAGLPFFPAEFSSGGEKIKITRSWQAEFINNYANEPSKRIFIRLQPPEYRVYEKYSQNISFDTVQILYQQRPDLEILWFGQIKPYVYLILEQTPVDLDNEVFTQYVVKLNNPNSINVLGNTELQKLIPILKNEIQLNPFISLEEMTIFLGTIYNRYSPEYYSGCIKERQFTRNFKVRWDYIPAGKSLPIRKWQRPLSENLSISVPIPSDSTINEDFFVKEYLNVDNNHYLILQAERTLISGEKWEAYLVKLRGNNIISLSNDLEFQHVAQLFIDYLEKPSPGNIFRPLGSIRNKEVELILDYLSSYEASNDLLETQTYSLSNLEKTPLTNLILVKTPSLNNQNITFKVAELGQKLIITKRWRFSHHLYLSLSFPQQINDLDSSIPQTPDFSTLVVECIFPFNLWYYIVLSLPEDLFNQSNKPRFILKIQDTDTLITLTEEELGKVNAIYHSNKHSGVNTLPSIFTLLNSLANNIKTPEIQVSKSPSTKPSTRVTKPHLGTISSFHLDKVLSAGSIFTNYLATQTNLGNRTVLLKILSDKFSRGADDKIAGDLIKQACTDAKLDHPNVIKIYQAGKSQGYYFISIQYVKGKNIFEYLREKPFIAPMQLLFIVEQIADALDYAHQNGVLHADISPLKILITPNQQAFLFDFENKEDSPLGNPRYFAPEQMAGEALYPQTDIYRLSLVIYEALTGHIPFESDGFAAMLSKKLSNNIKSLQDFNKLLPKSLDSVFQKALASDPKERYKTAKEFFIALREALSTLSSLAPSLSELAIVESSSKTNRFCLGLSAGSYYLEHLLGEGMFSWVYYGVDSTNLNQRAFKIAKPPELIVVSNRSSNMTQEIEVVTGGLITQIPNIYQTLQFQVEKTQKVNDIALVKIDRLVHTNNICYYQMEFIAGQSLRELMNKGNVPIRVIIEIALALERLSQNPNFRYHGDLKPENIIVNDTEIKFIDLGYFGCEEKTYLPSLITTPAYYPDLQADDLFALGLIAWEIVCHQQPFTSETKSSESVDLSNIGENLFEWVYYSELVGQYFKSPILQIKRPSKICADISPLLEDFLLKAINLYIRDDNKLDRRVHFKTFSQFANALAELLEAGITYL
ncbi:MAG: protein kinase [Acidobacteria bacterium]|nr:protein kinase [Acidobacteriota bacterium]